MFINCLAVIHLNKERVAQKKPNTFNGGAILSDNPHRNEFNLHFYIPVHYGLDILETRYIPGDGMCFVIHLYCHRTKVEYYTGADRTRLSLLLEKRVPPLNRISLNATFYSSSK